MEVYDTNFHFQASAEKKKNNWKWVEVNKVIIHSTEHSALSDPLTTSRTALKSQKPPKRKETKGPRHQMRSCTCYNYSSPSCGFWYICMECHGMHRQARCPWSYAQFSRGGPRRKQRKRWQPETPGESLEERERKR